MEKFQIKFSERAFKKPKDQYSEKEYNSTGFYRIMFPFKMFDYPANTPIWCKDKTLYTDEQAYWYMVKNYKPYVPITPKESNSLVNQCLKWTR